MIAPHLCVETLVYRYDPTIPALNGVDLELPPGAFCALIGQNGSGKTTLAKHLNGLLRPNSGRVLLDGQDCAQRSIGELARSVGYVFQNPDHQIFAATVREELAFGPRNLGCEPDEIAERGEDALGRFDLMALADAPPAVLGYGQRRLVTIAAVVAMRTPLLILDEPTTGLDWRSASQLMALLAELNGAGHTILLITHDMRLVCDWTPRTLLMHEGRLLADGPTAEVMARSEALARAQVAPPQVVRLGQSLRFDPTPLTVDGFCQRLQEGSGGAP